MLEIIDALNLFNSWLQGGGFCVPGDGPTNCNARCKNGNQLCTARTNPTFKFGANGLGATIASKNSTLNPAFHDFSNGNSYFYKWMSRSRNS